MQGFFIAFRAFLRNDFQVFLRHRILKASFPDFFGDIY